MALEVDVSAENGDTPKEYDYKSRCEELEAALNETRSALDDFQLSSRELEAELERELENMEKQYTDAKRQKERLRMESDEWKSKFQQAKAEFTASSNAMQKEIDALREAQRVLQQRLRDVEMSNDDMERNDRVVKSSLEDVQLKYDKATEEIVLLKTELAAIETLRIENQRLKDELRDLKEEYTVLKERQPPPAIMAAEEEGAVRGSPVRHSTPPSPPISDGSRALTPSSETVTSPPKAGSGFGVGGINGNGTWREVKLGRGPRMSIASDVSWASEARQTSSVKIMHDMVSRVKNLEARLQACRDLVNPLLDASPLKGESSPTKEFLLSPQKSPEKDILCNLPQRMSLSRPQSQLSNPPQDRYRGAPPRTPSSSRRLTFGRPHSAQQIQPDLDEADFDEGDITITLENTANITPRRPRHKTQTSTSSRTESRLSLRSVSQGDDHHHDGPFKRPESATFKRPESATGRRTSAIPTPAPDRRTSGILAPSGRRTSGIPAPNTRPMSPTRASSRQSNVGLPARPVSPARSTSSSSFHSDTHSGSIVSPSTSHGSMGAPPASVAGGFARRQSSGLPILNKSGIARKSVGGSGIPVPR